MTTHLNMIDAKQLRDYVIAPALKDMSMWSLAAEKLMVMTAAHESHMGHYLHQVKGPAMGIYQMEPATFLDMFQTYLDRADKIDLKRRLMNACNLAEEPARDRLIYDLRFATIMARLKYWRAVEPLPDGDDIEGLAAYYKKYYNTNLGKASIDQVMDDYKKYAEGLYDV